MLSVWVGFFVACHLAAAANVIREWSLGREGMVEVLAVYPHLAVVSGLTVFILGSNYWGFCYVVGMAFFTLSLIMPIHLIWAPLEFGAVWAAFLTIVGLSASGWHAVARRDVRIGRAPRVATELFAKLIQAPSLWFGHARFTVSALCARIEA
jgi:hypothetical protein